ncbi:Protein Wnt-5 [Trichinella spiralis]|uniref:Protein Wnt-5 n=1 Tax=Trichinella spiralis TaxID=6334 RepID=A0ABR3K9F9_TRISP
MVTDDAILKNYDNRTRTTLRIVLLRNDAQVHELHVIYDNFVRSLSEILDYCTFMIIKFLQVEPFIRGRRKKRVEIINQQFTKEMDMHTSVQCTRLDG